MAHLTWDVHPVSDDIVPRSCLKCIMAHLEHEFCANFGPEEHSVDIADGSKVQPVWPILSQAPSPKARAEHENSFGEGGLIRT